MKNLIRIILIVIIVIINSCGEGITEPQPGRRDYVWEVDTLNMPMNLISSIWGSSPDDVWVVGGGGDSENRLLHYDGQKWENYNKESIYCTGQTLFGFSRNNVWMGGGDGRIWHYDGANWSENYRYIVEGAVSVTIANIWGQKPNDIYACGTINYQKNVGDDPIWRGFILHYDGISWKEIIKADYTSKFLKVRKEGDNVYIFDYRPSKYGSDSDVVAFDKIDKKNNFTEIYSGKCGDIVWGNLYLIEENVYFLIGKEAYRYINNKFEKRFSLDHSNFGYQFYGRNENDIFVRMKDGLAHYNGKDIAYLYTYPIYSKSIISEPQLFDKEVFFILWEPAQGRNMVLHGILK